MAEVLPVVAEKLLFRGRRCRDWTGEARDIEEMLVRNVVRSAIPAPRARSQREREIEPVREITTVPDTVGLVDEHPAYFGSVGEHLNVLFVCGVNAYRVAQALVFEDELYRLHRIREVAPA